MEAEGKSEILYVIKEEILKIEEELTLKKEQATDGIIYELVELENARLNDWSHKIIVIIDKDTLDIPCHPKEPRI